MPLFVKERFRSHSGLMLDWKIECEALTTDDWVCLAKMASLFLPPFRVAEGIPRGGLALASAMEYYGTGDPAHPILICDDVYTTGRSMDERKNFRDVIGLVAFARGKIYHSWVRAIFQVHPELR